jgi:uncharacterized protein YcfL
MLMITSSPAPDSASSVTSVCRLSNEAQSYLQKHFAAYWQDTHAVACDNCGRKYKSDAPKKPPSWAQTASAGQGS